MNNIINTGIGGLIALTILLGPILLTFWNVVYLIGKKKLYKREVLVEILTLLFGPLLSYLYIEVLEITSLDWSEVLTNSQKHTPIATEGQLTVIVLTAAAILGYLLIRVVNINKLPPLIIVFSIACMYIGMGLCLLWIIQVQDFFLLLFPLNCIVIALKTIRNAITEWRKAYSELELVEKNTMIHFLRQQITNSQNWVWMGFVVMIPVLGLFICILTLFGQRPDALIRAWTETSDWHLSQQISPPNVQYDEHYLCTVAAAGHRQLVKPQRMGIRHGHRVTVNRQLCIANAFEQILEEKMPRIHRKIRGGYDRYGYPIARNIHSPYTADIIYVLMKPAEYFFLFIIYLVDTKPENRISLQYIPKPKLQELDEDKGVNIPI